MVEGAKLPVCGTALTACRSLAMSWKSLLAILTPLLALLVLLDFALADFWSSQPRRPDSMLPAEPIFILLNLDAVLLLAIGALAVALWQRQTVFGRSAVPPVAKPGRLRDIAAMTLHWGALIVVWVGTKLVADIPVGIWAVDLVSRFLQGLGKPATNPALYRALFELALDSVPLLVAFHITGRLGVVLWALPGAMTGALERAWIAGRGNGWRIALALYVVIMPVQMMQAAFQSMPDQPGFELHFLLWPDIFGLLQLILAAAVIDAAYTVLATPEEHER